MRQWFAAAQEGKLDGSYWEHTEHDKGHGRLETRVCRGSDDVARLAGAGHHWAGIQRLVMLVERTRQIREKVTTERCYYISSKAVKAAEMAPIHADYGRERDVGMTPT